MKHLQQRIMTIRELVELYTLTLKANMNKYITYYANGTHDIKQVGWNYEEHQNIGHAFSSFEDGMNSALDDEQLFSHYANKLEYETY